MFACVWWTSRGMVEMAEKGRVGPIPFPVSRLYTGQVRNRITGRDVGATGRPRAEISAHSATSTPVRKYSALGPRGCGNGPGSGPLGAEMGGKLGPLGAFMRHVLRPRRGVCRMEISSQLAANPRDVGCYGQHHSRAGP
jgi:hypothetical protein